jgi:hypothetical protein
MISPLLHEFQVVIEELNSLSESSVYLLLVRNTDMHQSLLASCVACAANSKCFIVVQLKAMETGANSRHAEKSLDLISRALSTFLHEL